MPFENAVNRVSVKNVSGVPIPPFAVMQITGVDVETNADGTVGEIFIQVSKPSIDHLNNRIVFNDGTPILPDSAGMGFRSFPAIAGFNPKGNAPIPGEIWGVSNGSWFLNRDRMGFSVLAYNANTTVMLIEPMETQYQSIVKVNGTYSAGFYPGIEFRRIGNNGTNISIQDVYLRGLNNETLSNGSYYYGVRTGFYKRPIFDVTVGGGNGGTSNGTEVIIAKIENGTDPQYGWIQQYFDGSAWITSGLSGHQFYNPAYNVNGQANATVGSRYVLHQGDLLNPVANATITVHGDNSTTHQNQTISINYAGGGSFKIGFDNGTTTATTASIALMSSASAVKTALEALPNITSVNVIGNGTPISPYTIQFLDSFLDYSIVRVNISELTQSQVWNFEADAGGSGNTTYEPFINFYVDQLTFNSDMDFGNPDWYNGVGPRDLTSNVSWYANLTGDDNVSNPDNFSNITIGKVLAFGDSTLCIIPGEGYGGVFLKKGPPWAYDETNNQIFQPGNSNGPKGRSPITPPGYTESPYFYTWDQRTAGGLLIRGGLVIDATNDDAYWDNSSPIPYQNITFPSNMATNHDIPIYHTEATRRIVAWCYKIVGILEAANITIPMPKYP